DAAIAPWLLCDPEDESARLLAVVLIRQERNAAAALHIGGDAGIAMCRIFLGKISRWVDRELEQRRERSSGALRPNHTHVERRAPRHGNEDLLIRRIAPGVVLGLQRGHQRRERPVSL